MILVSLESPLWVRVLSCLIFFLMLFVAVYLVVKIIKYFKPTKLDRILNRLFELSPDNLDKVILLLECFDYKIVEETITILEASKALEKEQANERY